MNQYNVIGVMSGSSLDGVDICFATIKREIQWSFNIIKSITIKLPENLSERLNSSPGFSGYDLQILDIEYGEWIARQINQFKAGLPEIAVIGFHGHTVFHEPDNKVSLQIGRGSLISHITDLPVVDDFRTKDILSDGQGAPLVPMGDISLFHEYNAWVNLGGIANCTVKNNGEVLAWDIAPCNQVLNYFARQLGKDYDERGELAKQGVRDEQWIRQLKSLPYFQKSPPKSMSNQWIQNHVLSSSLPNAKKGLFTFVEFLSNQIVNDTLPYLKKWERILFTGGGVHNKFLMTEINRHFNEKEISMVIPSPKVVDFKEALIFGFLALLRKLELPNTLASATGASKNTVSGELHLP